MASKTATNSPNSPNRPRGLYEHNNAIVAAEHPPSILQAIESVFTGTGLGKLNSDRSARITSRFPQATVTTRLYTYKWSSPTERM